MVADLQVHTCMWEGVRLGGEAHLWIKGQPGASASTCASLIARVCFAVWPSAAARAEAAGA